MNNKVEQLINNIERSIIGKRPVIEKVVCAMLAGGHVLIEDVPGVGKTLLAETLAKSVSGSFGRIQFTPDLMPSDVIGYTVVDINTGKGSYKPGAAMCNFLLADEINRASPKVQSSLLEAMEELQISVDGETHQLPKPFMTLATQNPIETFGTYHLPEAQLEELMELRRQAAQVKVADNVKAYILSLVTATRFLQQVKLGASPRGSIAMFRAAQAMALMNGRDYATPDDVKAVAIPVLAHRIVLASGQTDYGAPQDIVAELLSNTHIPM